VRAEYHPEREKVVAVIILIVCLFAIVVWLAANLAWMEADLDRTQQQFEEEAERRDELQAEYTEAKEQIDELRKALGRVEGGSGVGNVSGGAEEGGTPMIVTAPVTSYAPECEEAVAGWDYEGDPSVTASGEAVVPYQTAAGGEGYEIGDRVYIEGCGWWEINDRGGGLEYWQVDRAVKSKDEAQAWGRQERLVIIKRREW